MPKNVESTHLQLFYVKKQVSEEITHREKSSPFSFDLILSFDK